jgi:hypothetical protein
MPSNYLEHHKEPWSMESRPRREGHLKAMQARGKLPEHGFSLMVGARPQVVDVQRDERVVSKP